MLDTSVLRHLKLYKRRSFFRQAALQSLAEPSGSPAFCALPDEKNLRRLSQLPGNAGH
jgi:hypothetical protein